VNVFLDGKVLNARSTLTTVPQIHVLMVVNVSIKLMVINAIVPLELLVHDVSANHTHVHRIHVNLEAVFLVLVQAMVSNVDVTKDGMDNIVTFLLATILCVKMVERQCPMSSHTPMTHHADVNAPKDLLDGTARILLFVMLLIHVKMVENVTPLMARPLDVSVKTVSLGNSVNDNQIHAKTTHV